MKDDILVLVVDDEADFRQLMTSWLESKGYSVIEAPDGKSAIQLVKKEKPDILLLDLHMPVMDGTEVLKKVREFNRDLPVIVISAYVGYPRSQQAMLYEVSGVFYKGRDIKEMLPLLESAFRTHKKLKDI